MSGLGGLESRHSWFPALSAVDALGFVGGNPFRVLVFDFLFGDSGSGNGQFANPHSMALDSSGNIFVTDSNNDRVQKFNSAGTYISKFGTTGTGDGQLDHPTGIAIDATGNLFVVDRVNNRVQKFNSSGTYVSKFGASGSGNGQFSGPIGITIDTAGNIYVVDTGNNRVQKFNSSGTYQSQFGSAGSGDGQFNVPIGIDLDSSGNLFVTDFVNDRVQKFNSSGTYVSKFGTSGSDVGDLDGPGLISIDAEDNIYIGEAGNNRVSGFTGAGAFIFTFGSIGDDPGEFDQPNGITVGGETIYVADGNNDRVQVFAAASPAITLNYTRDDDGHPVYPRYKLNRLGGWHSTGDSGDKRDNRVGAQGEISRTAKRRGKTITYEGDIQAKNRGDLHDAAQALVSAFDDQDSEGLMVVTPHPLYDDSGDFTYFNAKSLLVEIPEVVATPPGRPSYGHELAFVVSLRLARAGGVSFRDKAGVEYE